jgi:hypothetical protein
VVDPKNFDEKSFVDFHDDVCIIPPNSFALARTLEYFRIPRNVLTICLGKSTYARCGIIVNVTPFEPEWEGYVTLEFSNTTPLPAKIYAGEGCAQVLFFESDEDCDVSYKDRGGKYQGQHGRDPAEGVAFRARFSRTPKKQRPTVESSAHCSVRLLWRELTAEQEYGRRWLARNAPVHRPALVPQGSWGFTRTGGARVHAEVHHSSNAFAASASGFCPTADRARHTGAARGGRPSIECHPRKPPCPT